MAHRKASAQRLSKHSASLTTASLRRHLRVITEGVARFGRIDTLVNRAGIFIAKPFTGYTAEDYAAVTAVNLNRFFYITQLAIAEMEKNNSGHVVSITTSLADRAIDGVPSVLASLTKGGLNAPRSCLPLNTRSAESARTRLPSASSSRRCMHSKRARHSAHSTRWAKWVR